MWYNKKIFFFQNFTIYRYCVTDQQSFYFPKYWRGCNDVYIMSESIYGVCRSLNVFYLFTYFLVCPAIETTQVRSKGASRLFWWVLSIASLFCEINVMLYAESAVHHGCFLRWWNMTTAIFYFCNKINLTYCKVLNKRQLGQKTHVCIFTLLLFLRVCAFMWQFQINIQILNM